MCHILLHDPKFLSLLLRIDVELAAQCQAHKCRCGGALHKSNFPRKPRSCLIESLADFESRFSFCCSICRKRTTAMSVRFFGRRVYLALAVVLISDRMTGTTSTQMQLSATLGVPARTLLRWKSWWTESFPMTRLWQSKCDRFTPPVALSMLPSSLIERFCGTAAESMARLLTFLSPLTERQ